MRTTRPYTYLGTVQGMCRECREIVPCRVLEEKGAVYQERLFPRCGKSRARIAESVEWYMQMMRTPIPCKPPRTVKASRAAAGVSAAPAADVLPGPATLPVRQGCPHDCGLCSFHVGACQLVVFPVTNVCQLSCPICYTYNRPDRPYYMDREEMARLVTDTLDRTGPLDIVNITGGEPTCHPEILALLDECHRPEVGRVTMNSNGLRLAEDEALCRALAARGVDVILSLHTLRPATSKKIHGRDLVAIKQRALKNLERAGVTTTLLSVIIRGVNDDEIGDMLRLAIAHGNVPSVTVQPMTFTGQGGGSFGPRDHLPLDGAARAVEETSAGLFRREHFVPHPRAHPMCYHAAYYLKAGGRLRSFTDFMTADEFREMLTGGDRKSVV
jgi:7,8-dihydro-6-hydroxymethylpterin dimethyltransferase